MKSHAHPGRLPTPFIFRMAAARRPENAEAIDVAENMIAMLCARDLDSIFQEEKHYHNAPELELSPRVE